jgi:hypothetical protein
MSDHIFLVCHDCNSGSSSPVSLAGNPFSLGSVQRTVLVEGSKLMNRGQLAVLLTHLGNTPDEVASTLRAHGIQGVRNTARFLNPLVRYLHSEIGWDGVKLDVMQVDRVRLIFGDGRQEEASLPEPASRFLRDFNRGAYPQLEVFLNGPHAVGDREAKQVTSEVF